MPFQTLSETATSLFLGTGGVLATNLENVVVVVAAFCSNTSPAALRTGFAAGLLVLPILSWTSALVAELIPVERVGYLGLIPIAMGVAELLKRAPPRKRAPASRPGAYGQSVPSPY